jgi:hypothetical protein
LPAEISRFETRKTQMYKKKPVKNIKNKVKPKRRYQAKIINKNESILEKVNDEFA